MKKKGFTLVEMMVAVAILGMVTILISGLAGFTAGRVKSIQLKTINDALRGSLDFVGQKMHQANDQATITGKNVYGFRYYDSIDYTNDTPATPNMLVIVSSGAGPSADKVCTFIGINSNRLAMAKNTCNSFLTLTDLANPITPQNISISKFEIVTDGSQMMLNSADANIPRIKIKLQAYDNRDAAKTPVTLETTFTMDGENVRYLQS